MEISYRLLKAGTLILYNDTSYLIEYVRYSSPDLYLKLENIDELLREDKVIAPYQNSNIGRLA